MSKTSNGLIQKGDVVWVQYRKDPLWPALIQNVYPKKVTYVFFPIPKLEPGRKHTSFSCSPSVVYAMSTEDGLPADSSEEMVEAYDAAMEYMNTRNITMGSKAPRRPDAIQGEAEEENGTAKEAAPVATTSTEEEVSSDNTMEDDEKEEEEHDNEEDEDEEEEEDEDEEEEVEKEKEKEQPNQRKSRSLDLAAVKKDSSSLEDVEKDEPKAKKMRVSEPPAVAKADSSYEEVDPVMKTKVKKARQNRDVDVFSKLVFEHCDDILRDLWRNPKVRQYTVPRRCDIQLSLPSSKMLTDDDSDRLFEHIVQFVQGQERECRILPAIHLVAEVLFPEIIVRCIQMDRNMTYDAARLFLNSPENGTHSSVDTVVDNNHLSPSRPSHQISGLDALVRVACEERAKTVAANVLCSRAASTSYGMSNGLKYVVVVGVLFLTSVCLSSIFFLPTIGNEYIAKEIAVPNVHDPHARRKAQERDAGILREKVEQADINPPPIPVPEIGGGDDSEARRVFVKEMMKFAWDGYRKYAWGSNELRPVSKTGHSASIFGRGDIGATIVDAIDTLWLMGLREEYNQAREWIKDMDFKKRAQGDISVFETNIRFVGGLLSIYALTNDKMFLSKAEDIAKILLPAFDTPTGIPLALVNVQTGSAKNYGWASGGCSILSEFGSIQLEFDYLSNATGNPIYAEKAQKIRDVLSNLEKPDGLYPIYLNPTTGKWGQRDYSLGAMADSFYEYLVKQWVATGKKDEKTKKEYEEAIFAMEKKMLFVSEQSKLSYFANLHGSRVDHKMEHLACFAGGMFVLHAANVNDTKIKEHYMDLGAKIGHTCHESYARSPIGIGPEAFRFTRDEEAKAISVREKYYILRPEVVETWFYLWRYTKDEKYRNWAWDVVQALEKHAKADAGYSGIEDVYSVPVSLDDVQQSFLLAELFKYLYLIFADDGLLPLDRWVLNTEAHPLPVRV